MRSNAGKTCRLVSAETGEHDMGVRERHFPVEGQGAQETVCEPPERVGFHQKARDTLCICKKSPGCCGPRGLGVRAE